MRGKAASILLASLLVACAAPPIIHTGVPEELVEVAEVPSLPPDVRFWGDVSPPNLDALVAKRAAQLRARYARQKPPRTFNYLALSGGGADGAYGAGFLVGWSESGRRPQFEVVTGISTGAMIAPFAFLGRDYDQQLQTAYLSVSTSDVGTPRLVAALAGAPSLADNTPLKNMIEQFASEELIQAIAAQHRLGRRLLVGTTNLDAGRPVVWDMGAIAASDDPGASELFRSVLLASASVPGVFPPVTIEVAADGRRYQELHVDGGVATQVFLFPTQVRLRGTERKYGFRFRRRLFVIRNTKLESVWAETEAKALEITKRSLSTLMRYQGIGDLIRLYRRSKRDGMDYNLTYIPPSWTRQEGEAFDPEYMRALFEVGYEEGKAGGRWKKAPPGFSR